MLTAILTCGLGMTLTSCSDSDDKNNDKDKEIVNPATDDEHDRSGSRTDIA